MMILFLTAVFSERLLSFCVLQKASTLFMSFSVRLLHQPNQTLIGLGGLGFGEPLVVCPTVLPTLSTFLLPPLCPQFFCHLCDHTSSSVSCVPTFLLQLVSTPLPSSVNSTTVFIPLLIRLFIQLLTRRFIHLSIQLFDQIFVGVRIRVIVQLFMQVIVQLFVQLRIQLVI